MSGPRYPRNWAALTDVEKLLYHVRKARRLAEWELRVTSRPEWQALARLVGEMELETAMREVEP